MKGGGFISTPFNKEKERIISDFITYSVLLGAELDQKDNLTEVESEWFKRLDAAMELIDKDIVDKVTYFWKGE